MVWEMGAGSGPSFLPLSLSASKRRNLLSPFHHPGAEKGAGAEYILG